VVDVNDAVREMLINWQIKTHVAPLAQQNQFDLLFINLHHNSLSSRFSLRYPRKEIPNASTQFPSDSDDWRPQQE
jgi:hypothetical protein